MVDYVSFDMAAGSPAYPDVGPGPTHDMHFDATGNLKMVSGREAISQRVRQHIEFYQGEWFLDTEAGLPWLQEVYQEPFDQITSEAILKNEVLEVPGVEDIVEFEASRDNKNRGFIVDTLVVHTELDEEVVV